MWIFRKNRGHSSLETLSEYMDGRLLSGEREKVERHLSGCSQCSAELESLRYTVSLLRRVPVTRPRSVYTLAEAPPLTSTSWRARVPVWAYGAAASVFVALFALVLSADLTGSLAGDGPGFSIPSQEQASPPVSLQLEPMSDPEAEQSVAVSTPTATPEPQPTTVREAAMEAAPALTPTPRAMVVSRTATPAPQPTSTPEAVAMEAALAFTATPQAAAAPREVEAMDDGPAPIDEQAAKGAASPTPTPHLGVTPLPAPTATPAPIAAPSSDSPEGDAPPDTAVATETPVPAPTASPTAPVVPASPTVAGRTDGFQQATTPSPMATAAPDPTPAPVQTPTIPPGEEQLTYAAESLSQAVPTQKVPPVEDEDGSTPVLWRVLEGVLGAAAVILVAGILWRLRHRRGRAVS